MSFRIAPKSETIFGYQQLPKASPFMPSDTISPECFNLKIGYEKTDILKTYPTVPGAHPDEPCSTDPQDKSETAKGKRTTKPIISTKNYNLMNQLTSAYTLKEVQGPIKEKSKVQAYDLATPMRRLDQISKQIYHLKGTNKGLIKEIKELEKTLIRARQSRKKSRIERHKLDGCEDSFQEDGDDTVFAPISFQNAYSLHNSVIPHSVIPQQSVVIQKVTNQQHEVEDDNLTKVFTNTQQSVYTRPTIETKLATYSPQVLYHPQTQPVVQPPYNYIYSHQYLTVPTPVNIQQNQSPQQRFSSTSSEGLSPYESIRLSPQQLQHVYYQSRQSKLGQDLQAARQRIDNHQKNYSDYPQQINNAPNSQLQQDMQSLLGHNQYRGIRQSYGQ